MIVKFFYLQTSLSWTVNVALITEKKLPQPNSMETDQTRTLIVTLITEESEVLPIEKTDPTKDRPPKTPNYRITQRIYTFLGTLQKYWIEQIILRIQSIWRIHKTSSKRYRNIQDIQSIWTTRIRGRNRWIWSCWTFPKHSIKFLTAAYSWNLGIMASMIKTWCG